MRRISFAHTEQAVIERRKDVTRRIGWLFAKPGMRLLAVDKLRTTEAERLAVIEIVSVRRELLHEITESDVRRECVDTFLHCEAHHADDDLPPAADCVDCFIDLFTAAIKCDDIETVTRIEFRYVDCNCGARPACVGAYEGMTEIEPACNACCGHGNEDGRCWPLKGAA